MRRLLSLLFVLGCCTVLSVLVLSGCGGDDPVAPEPEPEPEPRPVVEIDGALDLPEGWTGDPAELRVVDVLQETGCDAAGAFTLKAHEDLTQLALALGPDDGLVLLGWFDAGNTVLSTRSTAEVLAWMGVGAWMYEGDAQAHIRDVLSAPELELGDLEAAWAAMLADAPGGLVVEHQGLQDALEALVSGLLAETGKGVVIEPGAQQSGIDVLNQGGINHVSLQNVYRRRVAGFLWRLGYRDTNDLDTMFEEPELVEQFEIPPVSAFSGVLGSIVDIFTGAVNYEPVQTDPIRLDWRDDAKRDYYRFNALGLGQPDEYPPDFFTTDEIAQGIWVGMKNIVLDFFLPLFFNVAGAVGTAVDEIYDEGDLNDLNDFISFASTTVPDLYTNVRDGHFWPALHSVWDAALTNGIFQERLRDLIAGGLVRGGFSADEASAIMDGVDRAFFCIGIVDLIGGFMDNGIVATHFALSRVAETWDFTVTTPVVHIEPREDEMMTYGTRTLTLVIDDDTGGYPEGWAYAYRWRCDGAHGTLVNPVQPEDTSNDFLTSSDWVYYIADNGTEGDETVTCELHVTLQAEQTYIRDATCELEVIKQSITIADTLKTCPGGQMEIVAGLHPPYEGDGVLHWRWDGSASNGGLRDLYHHHYTSWVSTDPIAVYQAPWEGGDDRVTCIAEVHMPDETVVGLDTLDIFIEDIGEFEPFPAEHFCYTTWTDDGNGGCTEGFRIAIRFEEIPGVLRYRITGWGFNDPLYYGDSYDLTIRARYLEHMDGYAIIGLTSGSSWVDCNEPSGPEELCEWMWRFEGAQWEVSPVCP